jgi:hypothetical protein
LPIGGSGDGLFLVVLKYFLIAPIYGFTMLYILGGFIRNFVLLAKENEKGEILQYGLFLLSQKVKN